MPSLVSPLDSDVANGASPGQPAAGRSRFWLLAAIVVVVVAIVGVAIGLSLGSRQGGPLASQNGANGRPAIVVPTPAPGAAASAVASPSAAPSSVVASATASAQVGASEYVVQPGDTLRSIALDEYGDAEQWQRIYQANRDTIGPNPDALVAGTRLQIPPPQ
ncbi:MAG: LysM peptidoglycan-binding domain-containing protein [Chloroflexi bacterium]|nr:LysM peptidoglycan-binding domain-containing protein [Chloroflexota bacterium]MBV9600153.1 LysM peptidoglycan-binding domain-containing protein [Chloroflexota bacterium]